MKTSSPRHRLRRGPPAASWRPRASRWFGRAGATLGVLAATLTAPACRSQPPEVVLRRADGSMIAKPPVPDSAEEQEAAQKAQAAQRAEATGKPAVAQAARDEVLRDHPSTDAAARILEERARAADAQGRTRDAIDDYEKLLFYRAWYDRAGVARERYAELLALVGRYDDAINMLRGLVDAAAATDERVRLAEKFARTLLAAGRRKEALELTVGLRQRDDLAASVRSQIDAAALRLIAQGLTFAQAEQLWSQVNADPAWAFLQPPLAFKLAKIYFHTRQFRRSEEILQLVSSRFALSPYASQAAAFLEYLHDRFRVNQRAVGVLLPLSGAYQEYGERSLHAIRVALGANSGVTLVVRDSAGDPTTAAKAVEELVLKEHVIAILGPLFSKPAEAAALKAEELSVPLVALSHAEGLPRIGAYVFRTALTVEAQAQGLAKVAFEKLGMRRFALLFPRTHYGRAFVDAFWDEVDLRRGEIRGIEGYEHDQTTFRNEVRKLVGRHVLAARGDYRRAVDELKQQRLTPLRMKTALSKLEEGLAPLVDFEAIVMPDAGRKIGLIAPALAFEDIVLTRDPDTLEKIKKATGQGEVHPVTLLGASTWNSPQTVESCERYCEEAVFVDAFYSDSPEAKVRDFVAAFVEQGAAAPQLSEAQAYDSAGLIRQVLDTARPQDREAARAALAAASYDGVTGHFSFDADGESRRELYTLTIKDRSIRLYEPPVVGALGNPEG